MSKAHSLPLSCLRGSCFLSQRLQQNACRRAGHLLLSVSVFKVNLFNKTRGSEQAGLAPAFYL